MERLEVLLSGFLKEAATRDSEVTLIFLRELWPDIVGGPVAAQTKPLRLRDRRLLVSVSNDTWKEGLSELRQMLRAAVNRFWKLPLVETVELQTPADQAEQL